MAKLLILLLLLNTGQALAALVKVTPLGSQEGEFCPQDRALLFEDPDGTRLLFDPGRTVAGASDPRLGHIDGVLVSHLHGDHLGNAHIKGPNSGCAQTGPMQSDLPYGNAVAIALGKKAKLVSGSEMPAFFAAKLKALGGDPRQSLLVRFGGQLKVGGVTISTVPAIHSNGVGPEWIGGDLGSAMAEAGIKGDAGPATGFILRFSNGLVAYLSGDTGLSAEQKYVVHDYYRPGLAVINIGDTYTTGPKEAAFVVEQWLKPASVIASHANEVATEKGQLQPDTRSALFLKAVTLPAYLPLSGRTLAFDGQGRCQSGW
ncbi:MBL fold metallo-hydrolase [Gallaecimonas xiamenensis]|uniref:Metal-dependent hydrolase-like protein n=1 Tax=Gallaecimonas xiamenensis 3-C-1 TaxID=745411 RepID=K2KFN6_9GAMM|nr:MBL fold metallo-hydrolase [Gallaecimonas xiamenensis]EKE76145.1 metal-dependent hydrolase-like protein [Gallaecimonas xiamenensis 3-C-1]